MVENGLLSARRGMELTLERAFAWNRSFAPTHVNDRRWGDTAYADDANGQVTEARYGDGDSERFAYDMALNVTGSGSEKAGMSPWATTAGGRVTLARGPLGERVELIHDERRRVVERRVERAGFRAKRWRYVWDVRDRLVRCETPEGETWVYGYDPLGRRVSRVRLLSEREQAWVRGRQPRLVLAAVGRSALDVWPERPPGTNDQDGRAPVVGVRYLWDGNVIAEAAPLRLDGTVDWDRASRWHYEPGGFRPLAKEEADGRLLYVVTDHLGTPRELLDEAGQLVWAAEQHLWGGLRRVWTAANDNKKGTAPDPSGRGRTWGALALQDEPEAAEICPFRFQGQWEDTETGLFYNTLRYYDPTAAQYVSPDPIGLTGGYRSFGYVWSPTNWVDPLGLAGDNPLVPTPTGKGAAGQITGPNIPGGSQTGLSTQAGGGGIANPAVQQAYDNVPPEKRSFYHGKCCEADALSQSANKAGVKTVDELKDMTSGANSTAYNSSGKYLPPCSSCNHVLNSLNMGAGK
jgi:RHS repeat-associated protein